MSECVPMTTSTSAMMFGCRPISFSNFICTTKAKQTRITRNVHDTRNTRNTRQRPITNPSKYLASYLFNADTDVLFRAMAMTTAKTLIATPHQPARLPRAMSPLKRRAAVSEHSCLRRCLKKFLRSYWQRFWQAVL